MTKCEACRNLTSECAECRGDKQFLVLWNRYAPIKYLEPPKRWYKRYGLCKHFSKKLKRDRRI